MPSHALTCPSLCWLILEGIESVYRIVIQWCHTYSMSSFFFKVNSMIGHLFTSMPLNEFRGIKAGTCVQAVAAALHVHDSRLF